MSSTASINITLPLILIFSAGSAFGLYSLSKPEPATSPNITHQAKESAQPPQTSPSPLLEAASAQTRQAYESFTAFRGRIRVGINYIDFKQGYSNLGASMGVLTSSSNLNTRDALIAGHLSNALKFYDNAKYFWEQGIKSSDGYLHKSYFGTGFLINHQILNKKQKLDQASRELGMSGSLAQPEDRDYYHYEDVLPVIFAEASLSIDQALEAFNI